MKDGTTVRGRPSRECLDDIKDGAQWTCNRQASWHNQEPNGDTLRGAWSTPTGIEPTDQRKEGTLRLTLILTLVWIIPDRVTKFVDQSHRTLALSVDLLSLRPPESPDLEVFGPTNQDPPRIRTTESLNLSSLRPPEFQSPSYRISWPRGAAKSWLAKSQTSVVTNA